MILILGVAALQPDDFQVSRSQVIAAPAAAVFAQVNDFHKWKAWSPWEKKDLTMKTSYTGPGSGVGAIYDWVGNSEVGEGRMAISASHPSDRIEIQLEFKKPFPGNNTVVFLFAPDPAGTKVSWNMSGKMAFIPKLVGLFMNMDKMIGNDFELGLAQLKPVAEAAAKK